MVTITMAPSPKKAQLGHSSELYLWCALFAKRSGCFVIQASGYTGTPALATVCVGECACFKKYSIFNKPRKDIRVWFLNILYRKLLLLQLKNTFNKLQQSAIALLKRLKHLNVCVSTTTLTITGRHKIGEKQQSNSYHLIYTEILFLLSVCWALKVNSMNSLVSGH